MRNYFNIAALSNIEPGKYYWCGSFIIKEIDNVTKIYSYAYLVADDSGWWLEDTTKDGVTFKRRAYPDSIWTTNTWTDYFFVNGKYWTAASAAGGSAIKIGSSYDGFNWELEDTLTGYGQFPVLFKIYNNPGMVIGDPLVIKEYGIFAYDLPYLNVLTSRNMREWDLTGRLEPGPGGYRLSWPMYNQPFYALGKYWVYCTQLKGTDATDMVIQIIGFHSENGYDWTRFEIFDPTGLGCGKLPTDWDYFKIWAFVNYLNGVFYLVYHGTTQGYVAQVAGGYSYDGIHFVDTGQNTSFPLNTQICSAGTGKDRIHYGSYGTDPYLWGYGYSNNGFIGIYGK